MDNEVAEARARLAAKFGNVQLGGKGMFISLIVITSNLIFHLLFQVLKGEFRRSTPQRALTPCLKTRDSRLPSRNSVSSVAQLKVPYFLLDT